MEILYFIKSTTNMEKLCVGANIALNNLSLFLPPGALFAKPMLINV